MSNKEFGFRTIITEYPDGSFTIHSEDDYLDNYLKALEVKKMGDLHKAVEMLKISCEPPTIYKGHYRELFKIFRILNKQDLKNDCYQQVIERVNLALRYDEEMLAELCRYWSSVHGETYDRAYFEKDSNVKISDIKHLLQASLAINDEINAEKARMIIADW